MWAEITGHLYEFESAVLSGLDEEDYPFSVRCRPYPDASGAEVLKVCGCPQERPSVRVQRACSASYLPLD